MFNNNNAASHSLKFRRIRSKMFYRKEYQKNWLKSSMFSVLDKLKYRKKEGQKAVSASGKEGKLARKVSIRNSCVLTNRSRGLLSLNGNSRIMFRERASFGGCCGIYKGLW